jgi:phenylalanyl-tRNA synthetase beta chain
MGGEETGVTEYTRNVLLEAAYFLPASIRHTARELNLPSDASYRFERGVDPEMVLRASQRATELIQEIAGGLPAKEIHTAGKLPANPADVSFSYDKCDRVVGIAIKPRTVDEILEGFGLKKISAAKNMKWKVPSYRRDLQRDVDLIEEVVRAYGAEQIPGTGRSRAMPSSLADRSHDLESALRERLVARGLSEVRTSKLIPRSAAEATAAIELRNPFSEDHVALRPSLISGLLGVLDRNVRAGAERIAIFEIGRMFSPPDGKEQRHLGILLWGNAASAPHWQASEKRRLDFFDLKGAIESLATSTISFRRGDHPDLALATEIYTNERAIGFAGQLREGKADAAGAVFVAELDVDLALRVAELQKSFQEIEKFPAITRDIAMIVPEEIPHAKVLGAIEEPKEPLLESVELFDLFTTDVGEARKSLAYRLTYRNRSRTLTSEEVSAVHAKIRERLQRDLGAELRE